MDNLKDLIQMVQSNWVAIAAVLLAFVRFVEAVIVATKTKKDDEIFARIKEILRQYFKIGWD